MGTGGEGGMGAGMLQLSERGIDTSGWKPPGAAVARG